MSSEKLIGDFIPESTHLKLEFCQDFPFQLILVVLRSAHPPTVVEQVGQGWDTA